MGIFYANRGSINPWALDHWWRCHFHTWDHYITIYLGGYPPWGWQSISSLGFVPLYPQLPMKWPHEKHDIFPWNIQLGCLGFPVGPKFLPRCPGITKSWTNCDYQHWWFPRPSHLMWKLISLHLFRTIIPKTRKAKSWASHHVIMLLVNQCDEAQICWSLSSLGEPGRAGASRARLAAGLLGTRLWTTLRFSKNFSRTCRLGNKTIAKDGEHNRKIVRKKKTSEDIFG